MFKTIRQKILSTALAISLFGTGALALAPVANAATRDIYVTCTANQFNYADTTGDNYSIAPGRFCMTNGAAKTVFQTDGNFVTYLNGQPVWQSHTYGQNVTRLVFQTDGNVVIYRSNVALWNTHTNGKVGGGGWGDRIMQLSNGQLNIYMANGPRTVSSQIW